MRNWSRLETNRTAFFSVLCPTWTTAPICRPSPSKTAYSLVSSISLVFCDTTSTDWSYSDGPAPYRTRGAAAAAAAERWPRGGGGGGGGGGAACWTWSVQPWPSHQRVPPLPAGSGYQPGGGGGCVTAVKLAPRAMSGHRDACQTPAMADLTDAEARVLDAVDEDWVVDRLCRLIAVPSIGGTAAESEVQHLLAGWLDELGCDVDTWQIDLRRGRHRAGRTRPGGRCATEAWGVVGTVPAAEDGSPALVLSGHTDVVPPGRPAPLGRRPVRPPPRRRRRPRRAAPAT